jgi:DNA-binding CsgD family transcriptional regulator
MATAMDARWFETYRGLNNLGRNILKLTAQHVTMEEICEHLGPCSNKNG